MLCIIFKKRKDFFFFVFKFDLPLPILPNLLRISLIQFVPDQNEGIDMTGGPCVLKPLGLVAQSARAAEADVWRGR